MPYSRGFAALLVIAAHWGIFAEAKPTLDFPINSQVPPVALESQYYAFIFSTSTFASSQGPLSYKLSQQPSWLQLNNATRLLSGTPDTGSAGSATFDLVATDKDGSTASRVTLVILASNGPGVGQPLLSQLAKAGKTSGPASLLLHPLQAFSFTFTTDVFTNTGSGTKFYAISANNAPLPPWLQFDYSILRFAGTTPPLVSASATPQTYGIKLIASDVVGFSEAATEFQIIVGYHIFATTEAIQTINITAGKRFSSTPIRDSLTLDGKLATDADVVWVASYGPKWVILDLNNISISGTPPNGVVTTQVLIVVEDKYGDIINASIILEVSDEGAANFFTGDIQDANATIGSSFSYQISPALLVGSGIRLSANLGNASSWLQFFPSNRTFYGQVPNTITAGPEPIILTATNGKVSDQRTFDVNVLRTQNLATTSIVKPSPTPTPASSPTSSTSSTSNGIHGMHMTKWHIVLILLATFIPVLFIVFLIFLLLRCRRRRRLYSQRPLSPSEEPISQPEVSTTPQLDVEEVPPIPVTTPQRITRRGTPPGPPQIDLPWAPDSLRTSKDRLSKRLLRAKKSGSVASSWQDYVVSNDGPSQITPPRPAVIEIVDRNTFQNDVAPLRIAPPNYSRKRELIGQSIPQRQESVGQRSLVQKASQRASQRASKALSRISITNVGDQQRLIGAGHGTGSMVPLSLNEHRSSWQTTVGSMPTVNSRGSMFILDKFPSPPDRENGAVLRYPSPTRDSGIVLKSRSPNRPANKTLRLARRDSLESSSLEAQRQKWYTERARDTLEGGARFSSASSRMGGRTISTALLSDTNSWRNTQNSWSRWSEMGPAGRVDSSLSHRKAYVRTPSRLRKDLSTTSSGQFDSTLSSDSLWEDENLMEEENAEGLRQWQATAGRRQESPSPRMPFEASAGVQENALVQAGGMPSVPSRRVRLAESKKAVNLEENNMKRSEKSQQGSMAFV